MPDEKKATAIVNPPAVVDQESAHGVEMPTLTEPTVIQIDNMVLATWIANPEAEKPKTVIRLGKIGVSARLINFALDNNDPVGFENLTDGGKAVYSRIRDHERNGAAMRTIGGMLRKADLWPKATVKSAMPTFKRFKASTKDAVAAISAPPAATE